MVSWCKGGAVSSLYFASHSWGQQFEDDITSLGLFAVSACRQHSAGVTGLCPFCEGSIFWDGALSINQHVPLDLQIVGDEGEKATENCIKATLGIVLVLDDFLQPFGRVWCLYELLLAVRDAIPLDVATSAGCPTRGFGHDYSQRYLGRRCGRRKVL